MPEPCVARTMSDYADEREVARIPVGDHPQRLRMGTIRPRQFLTKAPAE